VPFTRDFEAIKNALTKVELYNKTCMEVALTGVSMVVQEEWGTGIPCQVLLCNETIWSALVVVMFHFDSTAYWVIFNQGSM
jgi:hypothetical protein